ncbi:hypothetical protein [Nostoc commune]|uniref:hypothetical protein n=1 Tax=Nostoc commune TaxID=1178 RepID=UPI00207406D4|nr:hypothetical protein [Nostoc commune]
MRYQNSLRGQDFAEAIARLLVLIHYVFRLTAHQPLHQQRMALRKAETLVD